MIADTPATTSLVTDLNADVGEGCAADAQIIPLVSSVNISCGAHAGSEQQIRAAVRTALKHGVAIGAHPGWPDPAHFGRRPMHVSEAELRRTIQGQLEAFSRILEEEGAPLTHIKPHGALYNQAAADPQLAQQLVSCIREQVRDVAIVALAGSALYQATREADMTAVAEAFADRRYADASRLLDRSQAGAMLSGQEAIRQSLQLIQERKVKSHSGKWLTLEADTLCLHGDSPIALELAKTLRSALEQAGIAIRAASHTATARNFFTDRK